MRVDPRLLGLVPLLGGCLRGGGDVTPGPIPTPGDFVAELKYSTVTLNIDDYGGKYRVDGWLRVYPQYLAGEFHVDVYEIEGPYYTGGDYYVVAPAFELEYTSETDPYGFPLINFYQYAVVEDLDCEVEVQGVGTVLGPLWEDACFVEYWLAGTAWLSCFGEEMELPLSTWLNDPGTLVGSVSTTLWYDPETAPDCPYADPTPSPTPSPSPTQGG